MKWTCMIVILIIMDNLHTFYPGDSQKCMYVLIKSELVVLPDIILSGLQEDAQ